MALLLSACNSPAPKVSPQHLPEFYQPHKPRIAPKIIKSVDKTAQWRQRFVAKYSLAVHNLPIQEFLMALINGSPHNIVIDPALEGLITLKFQNQTLLQVLDLLKKKFVLRYRLTENSLLIESDTPYIKTYAINYLNIKRETESKTTVTTQISGEAETQANNSTSSITNKMPYDFWGNLVKSLQTLLATDTLEDISLLSEMGVLTVRATDKQHQKIKKLLGLLQQNAHRQVLIEATIAEVQLNQQHQAGIDWHSLGKYLRATQSLTNVGLNQPPVFTVNYNNTLANSDIGFVLKLLRQFGDINILSSPKILALNNQTALLRVVDNRVYFTTDVEITQESKTTSREERYTTKVNTVPEGLILQVTPQISADNQVMLNIHPSISRIIGYINDPNPTLAKVGITNPIPEIQLREIETILRVKHNTVVIMGGLMQDTRNEKTSGMPFLSELPDIGNVFRYDHNQYTKTELVLFLRPVIIFNE